jgi:hypothetical protein
VDSFVGVINGRSSSGPRKFKLNLRILEENKNDDFFLSENRIELNLFFIAEPRDDLSLFDSF